MDRIFFTQPHTETHVSQSSRSPSLVSLSAHLNPWTFDGESAVSNPHNNSRSLGYDDIVGRGMEIGPPLLWRGCFAIECPALTHIWFEWKEAEGCTEGEWRNVTNNCLRRNSKTVPKIYTYLLPTTNSTVELLPAMCPSLGLFVRRGWCLWTGIIIFVYSMHSSCTSTRGVVARHVACNMCWKMNHRGKIAAAKE